MTKYQRANSLMLLAAFANDIVIEYTEYIKSGYHNVAALELAEAKYNGAAELAAVAGVPREKIEKLNAMLEEKRNNIFIAIKRHGDDGNEIKSRFINSAGEYFLLKL